MKKPRPFDVVSLNDGRYALMIKGVACYVAHSEDECYWRAIMVLGLSDEKKLNLREAQDASLPRAIRRL